MMCRLQKDYALDNMLQLLCHSKTPAKSIDSVYCDIEYSSAGRLNLSFHVNCAVDAFVIPSLKSTSQPGGRCDDLWQSTCFEAFLSVGDGTEYIEFNFAPSGQWAAYVFSNYREKRGDLALASRPEIAVDSGDGYFELQANVKLPANIAAKISSIGISMVAEESGDHISYWALAHPSAKPDFHHRDCFTYILSAERKA
jgi:hypothetical protein